MSPSAYWSILLCYVHYHIIKPEGANIMVSDYINNLSNQFGESLKFGCISNMDNLSNI